jgi:hypothetical protein
MALDYLRVIQDFELFEAVQQAANVVVNVLHETAWHDQPNACRTAGRVVALVRPI